MEVEDCPVIHPSVPLKGQIEFGHMGARDARPAHSKIKEEKEQILLSKMPRPEIFFFISFRWEQKYPLLGERMQKKDKEKQNLLLVWKLSER